MSWKHKMSTDTSNKQGYKWISPRVKELTDKLSRENKNDVVRIVVDYHVNKNEKETIDKLRVVGAKYSRENDNETARNVAEIATIIMGKESKMANGGSIEVGDKVKATKEYGGKSGIVIEKRGSFVVVEDKNGNTESYHESDLIKKMEYGGGFELTKEDYKEMISQYEDELKKRTEQYIKYSESGDVEKANISKYLGDIASKNAMMAREMYKNSLNKMEKGGMTNENNEMLNNQVVEAKHHAKELDQVVNSKTNVEPWVVAKMERATTDLSDVTHYLDGMQKMAFGGMINDLSDSTLDRMEGLVPNSTLIEFLNNAIYIINDMEQEGFEKDEIMSFLSYKMVQMQKTQHSTAFEAQFENDYQDVVEHIESGEGYIDADYVETTWENISNIPYSAIEDKLLERIKNDGLLKYTQGGSMYAIGGEILGRNITFEDWKGDTRKGTVISVLNNGDYEVATDSGMALVTSDEIIKMKKGGYVPKSKKLTAQQQAKLEKVLHEYKMGELHSGSSTGPIVKSRKQALAIGLAEARSMAKGGWIENISTKKLRDTLAKMSLIKNPDKNEVERMSEIREELIKRGLTFYKKMAKGGGVGEHDNKNSQKEIYGFSEHNEDFTSFYLFKNQNDFEEFYDNIYGSYDDEGEDADEIIQGFSFKLDSNYFLCSSVRKGIILVNQPVTDLSLTKNEIEKNKYSGAIIDFDKMDDQIEIFISKNEKEIEVTPEDCIVETFSKGKIISNNMAQGGSLKPIPSGNKGLPKLPKDVRNKMGFMEQGGGVGDKLPPAKIYGELLYKAISKFDITESEARKRYGSYTIEQWEKLLGEKVKMAQGGSMGWKHKKKTDLDFQYGEGGVVIINGVEYKVGDTGTYGAKNKEKVTITSISPKIVTYVTAEGKKKGVYTYKFQAYFISDNNYKKESKQITNETKPKEVSSFKSKELEQLKDWKKEKINDLKEVAKRIGVTSINRSYIKSLERLDNLVEAAAKIIKSGILEDGEYDYFKTFTVKTYQNDFDIDGGLRISKSIVWDKNKYQDKWKEYKAKYEYADRDRFVADVIGEMTKPILGKPLCSSDAFSYSASGIGGSF